MMTTFALVGCGSRSGDLNRRLDDVDAKLRQDQAQLQQVEAQIAAAKYELARQQCKAAAAQMVSEVALEKAQCLQTRALYAECAAKGSAHTSGGGLLGCAAGLAAAVVTGGAATPLVAAGCAAGLGAGAATKTACGESPVCTPDETVLARDVALRRGFQTWPQCP